MKRHEALVPTPTSRDWKGCHASKGLLHEGRLFLLPSYVTYILEMLDPPPTGNEEENRAAMDMVKKERSRHVGKKMLQLADTDSE